MFQSSARKTLVLDLDHTLVYVQKSQLPNTKADFSFNLNKVTYFVYKRPFLENFLFSASKLFDVVIFTSAKKEYADIIIDWFDKFNFVKRRFYQNDCVVRNNRFVKDVSRLAINLNGILMVDDKPDNYLELASFVVTRVLPSG